MTAERALQIQNRAPKTDNSTAGIYNMLSGLCLQGSRKCFIYMPLQIPITANL